MNLVPCLIQQVLSLLRCLPHLFKLPTTWLTPPNASTGKKRGQYKYYTAEEKARIAKRSVQCGVTNTARHFPREFC